MVDHFHAEGRGTAGDISADFSHADGAEGGAIECLQPGDPAERRQVLEEWSFGGALEPQVGFLHELVEAQAERTPESVAVVWGEERMTYRELVSRARQLGGFLRGLGVGAEDRVGVLLERRPGLVA